MKAAEAAGHAIAWLIIGLCVAVIVAVVLVVIVILLRAGGVIS